MASHHSLTILWTAPVHVDLWEVQSEPDIPFQPCCFGATISQSLKLLVEPLCLALANCRRKGALSQANLLFPSPPYPASPCALPLCPQCQECRGIKADSAGESEEAERRARCRRNATVLTGALHPGDQPWHLLLKRSFPVALTQDKPRGGVLKLK